MFQKLFFKTINVNLLLINVNSMIYIVWLEERPRRWQPKQYDIFSTEINFVVAHPATCCPL
jgi:hypothetical protein